MDFYQKYELIDPLPGEGTRSFRARQIATGREVAVHLLTGGKTTENDALLTRLRTLPEGSLRKLIEVGDNDGTIFVATEAPPLLHLAEWLAEQERASGAADALKYTRAGSWKIPAMAAPPPPPAWGALVAIHVEQSPELADRFIDRLLALGGEQPAGAHHLRNGKALSGGAPPSPPCTGPRADWPRAARRERRRALR